MLDGMAVTKERVAEQLKGLRELHGPPGKLLSQEKAAGRADISGREWQRLERREVDAKAETLSKIADAYRISLEAFDNGRPEKNSTPLGERLDEINEKLDEILKRLDEPVTTDDEQPAEGDDRFPDPPPFPSEPPPKTQDPDEPETGTGG